MWDFTQTLIVALSLAGFVAWVVTPRWPQKRLSQPPRGIADLHCEFDFKNSHYLTNGRVRLALTLYNLSDTVERVQSVAFECVFHKVTRHRFIGGRLNAPYSVVPARTITFMVVEADLYGQGDKLALEGVLRVGFESGRSAQTSVSEIVTQEPFTVRLAPLNPPNVGTDQT